MTQSRLSWTGWLKRPGGDWSRAVVAPTWKAAWDHLLAAASEAAGECAPAGCAATLELLVNDGRHPDHRRRPR